MFRTSGRRLGDQGKWLLEILNWLGRSLLVAPSSGPTLGALSVEAATGKRHVPVHTQWLSLLRLRIRDNLGS